MKLNKKNPLLAVFLSLASFTIGVPLSSAATLYWDGNDSSIGFGTASGTWAAPTIGSSTAGWSTDAAGSTVVNATSVTTTTADSIHFGFAARGLAAGTINVSTVDAGDINYASSSTAILLSGGSINLSASSTIAVNNASNTINSVLTGASTSLTKTGNGTLTLTGANSYSGTTIINGGTNNANFGVITNIGGISISSTGNINSSSGLSFSNGGSLSFVNASSSDALINRVSDSAPITSNGGTINFNNTSGATVYSETIGSVALASGQLNVFQTNNQASTGSQTLTLSGLTRTGSTNTSAVTFSATSALNTTKNMIVVTGATATAAGQIIAPWVTTGVASNNLTDFAVYNSSAQIIARNTAASAETTWLNSTDAYTRNSGITATRLTATRNINALRSINTATTATINTTTDVITVTGSTYANGDPIVFSHSNLGGLPGGLTLFTTYFARDVSGATFKVAATSGGTAIDLTSAGSGVVASGGILIPSGVKLGTLGILGAGTGNQLIAGAGTVTLPSTTSDQLHVTAGQNVFIGATPSSMVNISAPITDNGVGVLTLVKNGAGTLVLRGTNTFTGGIVVNSGNLDWVTDANLGAANKPVTFTASSSLASMVASTSNRPFILNAGVAATISSGGSGTATLNGPVQGSGGITLFHGNAGSATGNLNSTANTFTGPILYQGTNVPMTLNVNSLADTVDSQNITFGHLLGGAQTMTFAYGTGATSPLVLNSRKFELGVGPQVLQAINNNSTQGFTINTDLLDNSTAIAKNLSLGGTGNGIFAGKIVQNASTLSITKAGAGKWSLSGANVWTGATTISAGTLQLSGAGTLGAGVYNGSIANTGTLQYSSSANQTLAGAITGTGALIKDTAASTLTLSSSGNTFSGNINVAAGTLNATAGSALGQASNTRTITIGAGAALRFGIGNILSGNFAQSNVPSLVIDAGASVTNDFGNNNALGNVTLTASTLTATNGSATYGAFNINGTVTSSGASLISTSDPINGRMMLTSAGSPAARNTINVVSDTLTISAPLAEVLREAKVSGLTKTGVGTLLLTGANTYSGGTAVNDGTVTVGTGGTLGATTGALEVNGNTSILNLSTTTDTTVGSLSGTNVGTINNGGSGLNFTVNQTTPGTYTGVIAGSGNFSLGNLSTSTLTISGTPTYTGSTAVHAGTLKLDYTTNDTSKLSDSAALFLGGGTIDLSGGTHTEVVNATTLNTNTHSEVSSSTIGAILQMNTITAAAGATVNFSASNIATTDNLNNASGILGTWATVGGVDFAMNASNTADGLIVAYTGYTDVPRTNSASQVIADSAAANVRIIEGTGSAANLTLGAATTTINTLNQSIIGGTSSATISPTGQTLRVNTILSASGAGVLTIGAGTLSTATAAGVLILNQNSTEDLIIDAVIANHTSASGLNKLGTGWLILNAANTYTGATVVGAGTLNLTGSITGSAIAVNGSSVFLQDSSGVIAGASSLTLGSTATSTLSGTNTHSGGTTLTTGNLILANASALGTGPFTLSGGTFNTDGIITSLASNNPLNWNGNFTYGGASDLNLGNGALSLTANSQVTVNANTLSVGGAISGPFRIAKAGAGTLALNGANTHSGGTLITGSSSAGKLILGHANALGTGPLTINGNGTNTIDSSVPNLTNLGNNAQNWQASFTFTGSENLNLGTGPVTMLGNRTVTVEANTLTIGGAIAGPGFNLTKSGPGNMVLSGVNTYTGNTNVSDGALTILGSGSLGSGNYAGSIAITSTFNYDSTAAQTLSGVISGAGIFNKSGTSTLTLTNTNTFTGTTTIAAGVLSLGNGATSGSLTGDILNNAALLVNNNSAVSLPGLIMGSGTLTKNGTGTLTLPASNDYTGLTNIIGGTITIAHETSLGTSASGTVVSAGGALESLTTLTVNSEALTLNGTGVSGGGALRVGGNKTLTWEGLITLGSDASIKTDSGSSINLSSLGSVNLGSNALTLQLEGSVISASDGIISGTGSLIKTGAASLYVAGDNTYSGLTTVNAGSLILQNSLALGATTSGTTVLNGARVELDNLTVTNESISLSGNGTNFFGALQGRSGASVWAGPITIDAADTRIGVAAGASLELTGTIDDGANDHRVVYRPADATATVIVSGANTYSGGTSILGPVVVSSLNKVVGGSPTSNLGAPITEANGMIVIGTTTVTGTLKYIGAGETTDRTIQIGANASPAVAGDTGGANILNDGASGALVFSAPNFNSPTNATPGTSPTRALTIGGTNTAANTISGIIQNNQIASASTAAVAVTKTGTGSWTLSGTNTYTGPTKVSDGNLTISGGNLTSGAIQVSDTAGQNASLTITAGTYNLGGNEFRIGMAPTTAATGTVNQTGGDITFGASGAQLLLGSNVDNVTTSNGVYNLSAGSITIPLSSTAFRGLMIGVNGNNSGSFLLSGTGVLNMTTASGGNGDSNLLIGRPENALHTNITGTFTQTGGTANIGNLSMGGNALLGPAGTQTLTLSGGTFSANGFARFSAGDNNIGIINIGGTSDVTLPAFPATRGAGATATVNFDGGTLKPLAASASYMGGLTNAFIQDGGAKFDTTNGSITITQALLTDVTSLGGGLTKEGVNALTLTGVNTYTGATTVTAGTLALVGGSQASPVTVSSGASLGFTLGSPTTSTSTFNLSAGTIKITGTPTLASYDLISSSAGITGTPVLDAPISGYELEVSGNSLKLVQTGGYSTWASVNAIGSNPDQDKDGDGVSNAVEYVLGGDKDTNDLSKLPTLTTSGGNMIFSFKRIRSSIDGATTSVIDVGTGLDAWPNSYNVGTTTALSSPSVTVNEDVPTGFDTITLTLPMVPDAKKFGRLKVTVTP